MLPGWLLLLIGAWGGFCLLVLIVLSAALVIRDLNAWLQERRQPLAAVYRLDAYRQSGSPWRAA